MIFFIIFSIKSRWFERQLFTVGELVIFDAIRGPDDARCKWRATTVTSISENEKTQKEFDRIKNSKLLFDNSAKLDHLKRKTLPDGHANSFISFIF